MKPISNDLRRRIIEAIQENEETQEEIAFRFAVSVSFIEKLWHRFRVTGSYLPEPHRGGRERALKDEEEFLRQEIREQSDITLSELCEKVTRRTGRKVTTATMCVELQRLDLPRKKR
jgi:transposase